MLEEYLRRKVFRGWILKGVVGYLEVVGVCFKGIRELW